MEPYSIYIHIPFCRHRCSYCDFNTFTGVDYLIPAYIQALSQEIRYLADVSEQKLPVHTIFIGGGTPSILPAGEIGKVISDLYKGFNLLEGVEITLEANPERLSYDYLRSLHDSGINRISLGMQSADPGELLLLERRHDPHQTENAVRLARKAGFENMNLDLIFGIPHQTKESWKLSLDHCMSLDPDHLSLYSLSVEPGTHMESWVANDFLPKPDEDLSAEMYEMASELLNENGFEQYEISNWAKRNQANDLLACKHNIQYWRNLPYLGLGAGSHGYAARKRTVNILSPADYIQKMQSWNERNGKRLSFPVTPAAESVIHIDRKEEMKETMMMGLRLTKEGISQEVFRSRFDVELQDVYGKEIDELIGAGLLERINKNSGFIRLTPRGRLLGNQVFQRFI